MPGESLHGLSVGDLLRRCLQVNTAVWSAAFPAGPTASQYAVLTAVNDADGHDQQTVGSIAALDKSTVTDVVRRLEEGGWLQRAQDADDARRASLRLTAPARIAVSALRGAVEEAQGELLRPLTADERPRLMASLRAIARVDPETPPARAHASTWAGLMTTAGHLMRRAHQLHNSLWVQEFGGSLPPSQYAILRVLAAAGASSQSSLGSSAALDKSSAADVCARLERRGLVTRRVSEADRRSRVVELTAEGAALAETVGLRAEGVELRFLEPLRTGERTPLMTMLEGIAMSGVVSDPSAETEALSSVE